MYSDRFGCYLRAKAKQPAESDWIWEGHADGFIAECSSASGEVVNISAIWMPGNPMSPAIAAREAVAQLTFTAPAVGFGPAPEINPWGITVVGYPYWLWADGGSTQTITDSVSAGGLTVALRVRLDRVAWNTGDGTAEFSCGIGTRWTRSVEPGAASPTCGHVFTEASQPGHYTVTATTPWVVEWSAGGATGTIPIELSSTSEVEVGELQTVRRR